METLSRHLKGILNLGNILDPTCRMERSKCLTLQHYRYCCEQDRDNNTLPTGRIKQTFLTFTVRVIKNDDCMELYRRLSDRKLHEYSFVFNAEFDTQQELEKYDEAMVASGYLVDMDEQFSGSQVGEDARQMTVTVKLLLDSITYIGENGNNRVLNINH